LVYTNSKGSKIYIAINSNGAALFNYVAWKYEKISIENRPSTNFDWGVLCFVVKFNLLC
jgi:hypothetical protein